MSQLAAAVAWGAHPSTAAAERGMSASLARWPSGRQRVVVSGGAVLGFAALEADRWRRCDSQPLVVESGQLAVVVDCRLDNRPALGEELGLADDTADSLLVLRAYERWDADFPNHLRGDFAGVVWDWRRRRAVVFRDPVGIKPLFYGVSPEGLTVASDVEVLVELTNPRRVPDDHLVVEHLLWSYQSTERTFWADLRRLPGGHVAIATAEGLRVRRYWSPRMDELEGAVTSDAVHETFRGLFFQSVARRLQSDAPVVLHLSGGIDSSSIVCAANKIAVEGRARLPPLKTVSARYPGLACDEGQFIEAVKGSIAISADSWDGRDTDFQELTTPALAGPGMGMHRTDGTRGDLDIARELGARVILSGDGGDQLGWPRGVVEDRVRRRMGRYARDTVLERKYTIAGRIARARLLLQQVIPADIRRGLAFVRGAVRTPWWLRARWHGLAASFAAKSVPALSGEFRSYVQQVHWEDLTSARLGRAMDLVQRCMSLAGVEGRFPFLDQDLVEFILSLGPERWPEPLPYARMQRDALAYLLPPPVSARTEKLSLSPILVHRTRIAGGRLRALFHHGPWASDPWVDRKAAQNLLEKAMDQGDGELCRAVRGIGTLEVWLRVLFGYSDAPTGRPVR